MKTGDKVSIHYCDIDSIGYGDSVNTDGIVIMVNSDGTVLVEYKDELSYFFHTRQKDFHIHDLTLIE